MRECVALLAAAMFCNGAQAGESWITPKWLRAPKSAWQPLDAADQSLASRTDAWKWRVGAGYDGGPYRVAKRSLVAGVERRLYVGDSTFLSFEALLTAPNPNPQLPRPPGAELHVRNTALHAVIGIRHEF